MNTLQNSAVSVAHRILWMSSNSTICCILVSHQGLSPKFMQVGHHATIHPGKGF